MNNERILELINAGIDGELSESEKSELQQIIDHSGEARSEQAGLHALAATMARVPQRDPPDNLRKHILDKVQLPGKRTFRLSELSPFAGYGLALAAGLIMIVGIYQLGLRDPTPEDISRMTGTITPQNTATEIVVQDKFLLDLEAVSGSVSLQTRGDEFIVDFDLDPSVAVAVLLEFADEGLQFSHIEQVDTEVTATYVTDGSVRLSSSGNGQFSIYLDRREDSPADRKVQLTTEIYGAGARLHQGVLETQ